MKYLPIALVAGVALSFSDEDTVARSELIHSRGCCASWKDGSLTTKIAGLLDLDWKGRTSEGVIPLTGCIGFDVPNNKSLFLFGGDTAEASMAGHLTYFCEKDKTLKAVAWIKNPDSKRKPNAGGHCVTYNMPFLPKSCFGDGSMYPIYKDRYRIDQLVSLETYSDKTDMHHTAINPWTCHPYWSFDYFKAKKDGAFAEAGGDAVLSHIQHALESMGVGHLRLDDGSGLGSFLHAPGLAHALDEDASTARGLGSKDKERKKSKRDQFVALAFVNATAKAPPADVFTVPSYCKDKLGLDEF